MKNLRAYLDVDGLESEGIQGWPFGLKDIVRFSELDPLNHVNNAAYLSWFETTRIEYIMHYGLTGMTHTEADPQIVVPLQPRQGFVNRLRHACVNRVCRRPVDRNFNDFSVDADVYSSAH